MPGISESLTVANVDITVMGDCLDIGQSTEVSALLELDAACALKLREGLRTMAGCEEGSDNNPLILWSSGKASRYSPRKTSAQNRKLPDLQVTEVAARLEGNRLFLSKGEARFFLQLEVAQVRSLKAVFQSDFDCLRLPPAGSIEVEKAKAGS